MGERVERVAVRLFWKAEHLDPSDEGDVPEAERMSDHFPASLPEHRREFWRLLAKESFAAMREPTEAMSIAGADLHTSEKSCATDYGYEADAGDMGRIWRAMIDAALAD